jgi:hypothetical protein
MYPEDNSSSDGESIMLQPIPRRQSREEGSILGLRQNPVTTPSHLSGTDSVSSRATAPIEEKKWFHSRRIKKGTMGKPWQEKKDPQEKWNTIIPLLGILLGFTIAGILVWDGIRSVVHHEYCTVLDEDWLNGFNSKAWIKEAELSGFG